MSRHPVFHYSPWAALGLQTTQHPTESDVHKAYKKASLHSHNGERAQMGTPSHRWPTIDHLKDSMQYFHDLRNGGFSSFLYPPSRFEHYPRTFEPQHPVGDPKVFTECQTPGFVDCPECYMTIPQALEDQHLTSHSLRKCGFCPWLGSTESFEAHYAEKHACHCDVDSALDAHIAGQHTCLGCGKCFEDLQMHLESVLYSVEGTTGSLASTLLPSTRAPTALKNTET
ncbi:hypothetical protein BKA67DRAFT_541832 [Truncatella angustata]|uniref:Uncharacterized protein n=1 Tax=Truncatella angustata TaxID=152316 RepID=A0A9P8UC27_9PEZI|nr:uncharacterized protein BKA67DRAFT_541832 [Truncatella angustata]KAH6645650.1 hypothetical protein BKA67DRAFT_541832 [Truncatella angustata]